MRIRAVGQSAGDRLPASRSAFEQRGGNQIRVIASEHEAHRLGPRRFVRKPLGHLQKSGLLVRQLEIANDLHELRRTTNAFEYPYNSGFESWVGFEVDSLQALERL